MQNEQNFDQKKLSRDDIIREIQTLGFASDQYVVVSGAVLAVHGLRNTTDIDLICTPELVETCKNTGWEKHSIPTGNIPVYRRGLFELSEVLHCKDYRPATRDLIARADIIAGIPFASLADTIAFKKAYGRPKDLADVELMESMDS